MKKYPIGIQDFSELRTGGFVYVDKTKTIFELVESGKAYFLSRPRRFGKSLLLSTLKYFFLGRRDLFQDLWVDREANHDWAVHPVIHFSFSSSGYKEIGLEAALLRLVREGAEKYGVELQAEGLSGRFRELIHKLGSGEKKLVLLIDEYDKPMIDYLDDLEQANSNREILKNFFSVLKDSDPYLRVLLITGVSKFSKVSLFSDLNHLEDLTIHPYAATITGYTQAEFEHVFSGEIDLLASEFEVSRADMIEQIRAWYNGYRWIGKETLYNPFSILNLVKTRNFRNFWWDTGTPTFLIKALEREFAYDFSQVKAGISAFDSYSLENLDWVSLMFQTGYLTIQHYDRDNRLYTLRYPNLEVKDSMLQYLLAAYRHAPHTETQAVYAAIRIAFDAGDLQEVINQVNRIFATIPHQIFLEKREAFFHAVLHLTFQGVGLLIESEVSTSQGRIDSVVYAKSGIYILEFKLDDSARAALDQIRDKQYGERFLGQSQPVIAVGIHFSSEQKAVAEWEAVEYGIWEF